MHDLFLHTAETTTTMCTKKNKQIATDLTFVLYNNQPSNKTISPYDYIKHFY